MLKRLYIIVAGIIAVLVALISIVWGITEVPEDVVASTEITGEVGEVLEVFTNIGVLEQINTQTHISLRGENIHFQVAVGQLLDVVAWLGEDKSHVVQGMESHSTLSVTTKSSSTSMKVGELNAKSDMWKQYVVSDNEVDFDWIDATNVAWSLLVVANSTEEVVPKITLSLSWKIKNSQSFLLTGLILSILLTVSCLVLHTTTKVKVRGGNHLGSSKTLSEIVNNIPSFELPKSSQIPSVREFARIGQKINNSGTVNGLIQTTMYPQSLANNNANMSLNSDAQFYASPVDNDNWRYYGDDSGNEYYENAITRNPVVTHIPENKFNVINRLNVSPKSEGVVRRLTRKELRDQGKKLFRRSKDKDSSNEVEVKNEKT